MNILDKRFKYTPAASTDIGARFKRIWAEQRREQREAAERDKAAQAEAAVKVTKIERKKGGSQ